MGTVNYRTSSYEDPAHSWTDAQKALDALCEEIADIPYTNFSPYADDIPAGA